MFFYLCKVVSTTASLLYPTYASYKALRPAASVGRTAADQAAHLERWLMFWCVMGCVAVWEQWAEWGVSWFPFYHEVKTLVVLWLVLPQIQGATYVYIHHLSPFLTSHEGEIDTAVTNARASATRMGMDYLNRAFRQARAFLLGNLFLDAGAASAGADAATAPADHGVAGPESTAPDRPPVLTEPALMNGQQDTSAAAISGLARFAGGLLRQYAPAAIAAGTVLLQPLGAAASGAANAGVATGAATSARAQPAGARRRAGGSSKSRREELEAELAALREQDDAVSSSSGAASGSEAESVLNAPLGAGTLSFVEIAETETRGYAGPSAPSHGARAPKAAANRRTSWFGWGAGGGEGSASNVDAGKKDA